MVAIARTQTTVHPPLSGGRDQQGPCGRTTCSVTPYTCQTGCRSQITVPVFPNWSVRRPNLKASRDETELDPAESTQESDTQVYLQRLRSVRSIDEMLDALGE